MEENVLAEYGKNGDSVFVKPGSEGIKCAVEHMSDDGWFRWNNPQTMNYERALQLASGYARFHQVLVRVIKIQ